MEIPNNKIIIGWREWVGLPDFGIKRIKAKIDTGARTSSVDIKSFELIKKSDITMARFLLAYGSRKHPKEKLCLAKVVENRNVTNSGGQVEERLVISTPIKIGSLIKEIEITLTPRTNMKFRMLLGRTAINTGFLIDVERSYLTKI